MLSPDEKASAGSVVRLSPGVDFLPSFRSSSKLCSSFKAELRNSGSDNARRPPRGPPCSWRDLLSADGAAGGHTGPVLAVRVDVVRKRFGAAAFAAHGSHL